ncbi:YopR/YscH family type III secretion effector [Pseudomonas sp. MWU13-3659]|uniref:YopR/YscH family type III secretion effector n=1 Tax=Pseudomonas sp. MWU13-3659 TaxID=2986964 RepID=UPI0020754CBA|nr:YopR/YscH family type III secretion effector [Pseudomonas sp. MWU13-3659]
MNPVPTKGADPLARVGPAVGRRNADSGAVSAFEQAVAVQPVEPVDVVSLTRELRERFAHPGADRQAFRDFMHERVPGYRAQKTALQAVWQQSNGVQEDAHLRDLIRIELGRLITLDGMVQILLTNKFKLEIES